MEYEIHNTGELYHHGIKGMRWGVRRYQNKDGSLTPAGQKRRAKLEGQLEKLGGSSKKGSGDSDGASSQPVKKTAGNMSDDELARAITRARMEDEYRRLRPEPKPPEKNAFAKQMLNDVIKPAAINSGRKLAQEAMDSLVKKITGDKVDPNSLEALKKTYEKMDYKQKIDKMLNPDKYLSEEDKNKRQEREFKAEDRAARKEGYADAADKANKTREAAEASRKAAADEAARTANEPKSNEYYNSVYSNKGVGERTSTSSGSSESNLPALYNNSTQAVGKSYTNNYSAWDNSYSSVANSSNATQGAQRAASIIDKYGNEFVLPDDYN